MCSKSETGEVSYDKLSFNKNSDRCTLEFKVFHNAGCAVVKASGFFQYLNSYPLINGLFLIAFGFFTWIYGKKHPRYVSFGLLALLIFLFFAIIFSYIGTLAVLEEDTETTNDNVIKASICITTIISVALFVSAYLNKWEIFVKSIIGGSAGICLGFIIYSLFVAMFIKRYFILFPILNLSFFGGIVLMWFDIENKEARATVLIGAYLIVRGLSLFLGEYPSEAQTFDKMNHNNLVAFSSVYIYILLFPALIFVGNKLQSNINDGEEKLNIDADFK